MGHPLSCDASFCFPSKVMQFFIALFFPGQVSRTHPRVRHASLQTGFASGAYLPPKARALEPCLPRPRQLLPQTFDITKRRIIKYVQSEHSDGCLHGSYLHALECCQRFNRLLDAAEPLPRGEDDQVSGGGDTHEDRVTLLLPKKRMLNLLTHWILTLFLNVLQEVKKRTMVTNHL